MIITKSLLSSLNNNIIIFIIIIIIIIIIINNYAGSIYKYNGSSPYKLKKFE